MKKWIYSAWMFLNIEIQSGNKTLWEQKRSFNYSIKKKKKKRVRISLSH